MTPDEGARTAATTGGWSELRWFASRAEARRLLLAALLAGRRPEAWYWRLAVPDWRGRPLEPWLGALLSDALAGDGEPGLLDIVTLAVEADAVEILLRLLAEPAGAAEAPAPGREAAAAICRSESPVPNAGEEERTDSTDLRGAAVRLRDGCRPSSASGSRS